MGDIIDFQKYKEDKTRNDARMLHKFLTTGKVKNCKNPLATDGCLFCNKCHRLGKDSNQ